jgi:hypothetical protein
VSGLRMPAGHVAKRLAFARRTAEAVAPTYSSLQRILLLPLLNEKIRHSASVFDGLRLVVGTAGPGADADES